MARKATTRKAPTTAQEFVQSLKLGLRGNAAVQAREGLLRDGAFIAENWDKLHTVKANGEVLKDVYSRLYHWVTEVPGMTVRGAALLTGLKTGKNTPSGSFQRRYRTVERIARCEEAAQEATTQEAATKAIQTLKRAWSSTDSMLETTLKAVDDDLRDAGILSRPAQERAPVGPATKAATAVLSIYRRLVNLASKGVIDQRNPDSNVPPFNALDMFAAKLADAKIADDALVAMYRETPKPTGTVDTGAAMGSPEATGTPSDDTLDSTVKSLGLKQPVLAEDIDVGTGEVIPERKIA